MGFAGDKGEDRLAVSERRQELPPRRPQGVKTKSATAKRPWALKQTRFALVGTLWAVFPEHAFGLHRRRDAAATAMHIASTGR